MQTDNHLNGLRRAALAQVERTEKAHRWWIVAAGAMEGICLLAFVLLADFGDRLHQLLLVTAFLIYGTLAFGLLALGAFTQGWCRRILKAIELTEERYAAGAPGAHSDPGP
ncbi:MAG: hypothetical protein GY778_10185 [bacterium]|nr:hypothetical protein [bacterium]